MKRNITVRTVLSLILLSSLIVLAGCGGGGGGGGGFIAAPSLVSIKVTPTVAAIAKGTTQQFIATGVYSNNSIKDLSSSVTWTSSNDAVAVISNASGSQGLATAGGVDGQVTITAMNLATHISGTTSLAIMNSGASVWPSATITSDPTRSDAIAYAMVADANYLYVAGYDTDPVTTNSQWRIEKRSKADGSLVDGFGTKGVVVTAPTSSFDAIYGLTIDGTSVYAVGIDINDGWRIEKRSLSNGQLDSVFGGGAAVYSAPTLSQDTALAVARDSTYLYIAGYSADDGDTHEVWKIEKRPLDTGAPGGTFVSSLSGTTGFNKALALAVDPDPAHNAMYVAGYDDAGWRIEKRNLDDGNLVSSGFGTQGVVNAAEGTSANAIATDGKYIYIAGENFSSGTTSPLIEKRDAATGALVNSIAEVPANGNDSFYAITLDPPSFYVVGYSFTGTSGDYNWRIEKRLMDDTLALDTTFNPSGATPGVLVQALSPGDDTAWAVLVDAANPAIYVAGYDSNTGDQHFEWSIERLVK